MTKHFNRSIKMKYVYQTKSKGGEQSVKDKNRKSSGISSKSVKDDLKINIKIK